jgi:hypothetical protein
MERLKETKILEKIIENKKNSLEVPMDWFSVDLEKFGLKYSLYDFQQKALENTLYMLYLMYERKEDEKISKRLIQENKRKIYKFYQEEGLDREDEKKLNIGSTAENYKFLSEFYEPNSENVLTFDNFVNRAGFWMATGSGKTLVMIKLLEILGSLINKELIPQKDILILAPKDEILKQISDHIDEFNKGSELKIRLKNLKQWESEKNQGNLFGKKEINVFYYRADNIADKNTIAKKKDGERMDYESIYNNGNWYIILDEAHKGDKETAKKQQYYTALTQNGFLFNFSATFTDEFDKVTTIFDYKLDTFLREGYGKKIFIASSNFRSFNRREEDDFSAQEKKDVIAQSLILFSIIKNKYKIIRNIRKDIYHSPLLVTLANSVNIENSDLKIFFGLLAEIAKGDFDFETSKNNLRNKLEENNEYLFKMGEMNGKLLTELNRLREKDFRTNVFNSDSRGSIEVVKFKNNPRELAFKLKQSKKYFMSIVASDVVSWEESALEGYEFGKVVEESFFKNIDEREDINILLGSRIFAEGWDTNRPNVMNYINIGVNEEAKKYVLQSIGRGIRIEPMEGQRKRLEHIDKSKFSETELEKIRENNKLLESLFAFATNKEVVKNILEEMDNQSDSNKWTKVGGIGQNKNINEVDLPIFIPEFMEEGMNDRPFWIGKKEYLALLQLTEKMGDKILLLKEGVRLRTINKIKDKDNFILGERRRKRIPKKILHITDNYFHESKQVLKNIKVLDGEIFHYKEVKTDLDKQEVEKLEQDIKRLLSKDEKVEELKEKLKKEEIDIDDYTRKVGEISQKTNLLDGRVNFELEDLSAHYYLPILHKENSNNFQHIIKVESEIKFLQDLKEYISKEKNKLKEFNWWHFSKIDESVDNIGIPYFDEIKGEYRKFSPDFIFWLKKGDDYYIKFIDPHGTEFIKNTNEKINGFKEFREDLNKLKDKKVKNIDLFFYNEEIPESEREYQEYFTADFDKIFKVL